MFSKCWWILCTLCQTPMNSSISQHRSICFLWSRHLRYIPPYLSSLPYNFLLLIVSVYLHFFILRRGHSVPISKETVRCLSRFFFSLNYPTESVRMAYEATSWPGPSFALAHGFFLVHRGYHHFIWMPAVWLVYGAKSHFLNPFTPTSYLQLHGAYSFLHIEVFT